jgi:hypothetical protein
MNNPNKSATASSNTSERPKSDSGSSPPSSGGNLPGDRLPPALDGFNEMIRAAHVDPAFPGENHSANVTFSAITGSIYENVIESLGISIFLFDDSAKMVEAKTLLTSGVTLEPTRVEDVEIQMGLTETGEVHVSWEEGAMLFFISATLTADANKEPKNLEILKRAAVMATTMVLKTKK